MLCVSHFGVTNRWLEGYCQIRLFLAGSPWYVKLGFVGDGRGVGAGAGEGRGRGAGGRPGAGLGLGLLVEPFA